LNLGETSSPWPNPQAAVAGGSFQDLSAALAALIDKVDVGKFPPLVDSNELNAAPKVVCITGLP
jgi:hypothetical protein